MAATRHPRESLAPFAAVDDVTVVESFKECLETGGLGMLSIGMRPRKLPAPSGVVDLSGFVEKKAYFGQGELLEEVWHVFRLHVLQ